MCKFFMLKARNLVAIAKRTSQIMKWTDVKYYWVLWLE